MQTLACSHVYLIRLSVLHIGLLAMQVITVTTALPQEVSPGFIYYGGTDAVGTQDIALIRSDLEKCRPDFDGYFRSTVDDCANLCLTVSTCIGFVYWPGDTELATCCFMKQAPFRGFTAGSDATFYFRRAGKRANLRRVFMHYHRNLQDSQ